MIDGIDDLDGLVVFAGDQLARHPVGHSPALLERRGGVSIGVGAADEGLDLLQSGLKGSRGRRWGLIFDEHSHTG